MTSILFLIIFVLLICLGVWAAFKYGSIAAYIGFAWVIPLAGVYWWNYELDVLNERFITTLIGISFLLSVICLPLILFARWKNMSVPKFLGLIVSAFFHSVPFLMYSLLTIYPPR
jgi:hypothetical protein